MWLHGLALLACDEASAIWVADSVLPSFARACLASFNHDEERRKNVDRLFREIFAKKYESIVGIVRCRVVFD
jgi:hypothetical protein